jgi:hypothetical protein
LSSPIAASVVLAADNVAASPEGQSALAAAGVAPLLAALARAPALSGDAGMRERLAGLASKCLLSGAPPQLRPNCAA